MFCARGFGIEKVYAMRKGIRRIHYSQKSIRVDYAVGALASGTDGVGRFGLDAQDSRFIDGEMTESGDRSGSALRAEHGMVSTATPSDSRRATTRRAGFRTLPAKSERPNGVDPLGLSSLVGAIRNGGVFHR